MARRRPQPVTPHRVQPPARRGTPESGFFLPRYEDLSRELAEAVRNVVNRYELRMGAPLRNSIAVTSVREHVEGTLVSQGLATVLAHEMDRFVCWFDLSWMDDRASADVSGGADLLDLLADHSRIGAAFGRSPEIDRLISLSFGPVPENKRNLIVRSPEFEDLIKIVTDEFDHVVFNMPPILDSTNAVAVLRHADLSLIVARHRSTTIAELERAVEETQPTPNLGVIVTDYRPRIPRRFRRRLMP
jgi:tyrosine-protein kinase Etk/Wzc